MPTLNGPNLVNPYSNFTSLVAVVRTGSVRIGWGDLWEEYTEHVQKVLHKSFSKVVHKPVEVYIVIRVPLQHV